MLWNYFRNDDCKVTKFSLKFQIYLKLFLKKVTFERKVGFEPTTPCLEGRRSSQLSYSRNFNGCVTGIEPATTIKVLGHSQFRLTNIRFTHHISTNEY